LKNCGQMRSQVRKRIPLPTAMSGKDYREPGSTAKYAAGKNTFPSPVTISNHAKIPH